VMRVFNSAQNTVRGDARDRLQISLKIDCI